MNQARTPASLFVRTNCCSRLLFCWSCSYLRYGMIGLILALKQNYMSSDDMLNIFDSQKANVLAESLEIAWAKQRKQILPSLGKAIWQVFWVKLMTVAFLAFAAESLVGIGFFLMSSIINNLVDGVIEELESSSLNHGLLLSGLFTIITLFLVFLRHNYQMRNSTVFVQIRQALTGLIYRKSLRLSLRALSTTTSGKIINAVSSDLTVLDQGHIFVTHLLFEPFVALVHLTLIALIVGIDILWGVIVMVGVIASQLLFARCLKALRKEVSASTDKRLKLLQSILSGIRIIKAYTWEVILKKRVLALRYKEYKSQLLLNFIKSSAFSILRFCGYVAVALVFYIKSARGETLEPGPSFAALATFNFLAFYVCLFMGYGITTLAEFGITLDRIKEIMMAEEKNQESQHIGILTTIRGFHPHHRINDLVSKPVISIEDVTISWGERREAKRQREADILTDSIVSAQSTTKRFQHKKRSLFSSAAKNQQISSLQRHLTHIESEFEKILNRVCLKIMPGELIGLIGPTGSGKTSLLHAIMGENFIIGEGQITFGNQSPRISYVPQEPFILADSVQNNITFGQSYSSERFKKVIASASLEDDIESLDHGQHTIVGEKGETLSGGQRARMALARALYSQADIYLFDDPLSAVDAKVSARLFSTIQEELKGKTRILVTHQSHVLPLMDRVIYVDDNEVKFFGTPVDLNKIEKALDHMMDQQKEEFEQEHQHIIRIRSQSVKEGQLYRDNSVSDANSSRREMSIRIGMNCPQGTPRTRKLSIFKEIKQKFSGN